MKQDYLNVVNCHNLGIHYTTFSISVCVWNYPFEVLKNNKIKIDASIW